MNKDQEELFVLVAYKASPNVLNQKLDKLDCSNPSTLNFVNEAGCSPLLVAIMHDDLVRVSLLLERGADPEFVHHMKYPNMPESTATTIQLAFFYSPERCMRRILKYVKNKPVKVSPWLYENGEEDYRNWHKIRKSFIPDEDVFDPGRVICRVK